MSIAQATIIPKVLFSLSISASQRVINRMYEQLYTLRVCYVDTDFFSRLASQTPDAVIRNIICENMFL